MHPILNRQLTKLGLNAATAPCSPEQWAQFLAGVDRNFIQFDSDRVFLERSMSIASDEMAALHKSLAAHNETLERLVAERTEQLKAALTRAEAASRAKSDFLTQMSHEIRTPLTAILGFSDILRDDGGTPHTPEERRHALQTIHSTGQHLVSVLSDILDLSMVEAGTLAIEKKETSLTDVLRNVQTLLRPRAVEKRLNFALIFASPVPQRIVSDPTRLRQMLINLAGNAIKYTQTGQVTVTVQATTHPSGPRLVIDVADTGCGMTPEQQTRLFQAFSQGDASITRAHGGTGLGLIIARRLANLIGGDVTLLRSAPTAGSCFRIDLPLEAVAGSPMMTALPSVRVTPAPATPAHPAATSSAPTPTLTASTPTGANNGPLSDPLNGKVLLVEDTSHIRDVVSIYLKRAGAQVETAEDGQVALHMIENAEKEGSPYALLITDVQMPVMDGYTLTRTLRERGSTLAIIALTAHAMSTELDKSLAAGCDAYASKPVDRPALIKLCAQWLGKQSTATPRKNAA